MIKTNMNPSSSIKFNFVDWIAVKIIVVLVFLGALYIADFFRPSLDGSWYSITVSSVLSVGMYALIRINKSIKRNVLEQVEEIIKSRLLLAPDSPLRSQLRKNRQGRKKE